MTDGEPDDTASDMATTCVVCGEYTTNKCGRCRLDYYCDSICQIKDWPTHKVSCQDIKLGRELKQVAIIVHEMFLRFRENTWDGVIEKVEEKDGSLFVYNGNPIASEGWFRECPFNIIPNNPRDKMAVLTLQCCNEPYGFFHELIEQLLEGLKISTTEISVNLANIPRETVPHTHTGFRMSTLQNAPHDVLRLTSNYSGKHWVFDIAGAQFGITEPFHVWTEYKAAFVESVVGIHPFGNDGKIVAEMAEVEGPPRLHYGIVGEAAKVLHKAANIWAAHHTALRKLRSLNHAEFTEQKMDLLAALDRSVRAFIETNDFAIAIHKAKDFESKYGGVAEFQMEEFAKEKLTLGRRRLLQEPGSLSSDMLFERVKWEVINGKITRVVYCNFDAVWDDDVHQGW